MKDSCMEDGVQTHHELHYESEANIIDIMEDGYNKIEVIEASKGGQSADEIHSTVQNELIPLIDMVFETEDDAFKFYKKYAYNVGFSIRKSRFHRTKDGMLVDRLFVCSAEGKRGVDKRDDIVKSHRAETRFGCQARMKISSRSTGKYIVIEFVPEHAHATSSPCKTHLFRSHRNMDLAQTAQADMADISGIAPKAALAFLSRQAGGREYLGFIPEDYRNYLRSKRTREMKVGDTGGVLEYLQKMQLIDPNFFYAIQVDEDDLITNIFWADARMMVDYDYFGDVICFDTTYRKNKEGRPFAMFVGVNNHKQTVIFGAALLYDETAETFSWLFDTFSKAMSGKKPTSILTDQDAAMAKALASQWPKTCHRLCIWHIYQNAAKNLSSVFEKFKMFSQDFSSCIYDYEDEECFLNAWNDMLEKYNLQDNGWLTRLFGVKEKWALVYGRETFCADITTTQRSESMNSSVKKYVSYQYDLLRFFEHFQRLVDDRRYEELKADFRATHSTPALSFPVQILKHGATFYTPKVLKAFQNEVCKSHDCALNLLCEVGTISKYEVIPHAKHSRHTVTVDTMDNSVLCSCKKFQFAGILCAHALKVLSIKNVTYIPTQYILKRWTKNVKAGGAKVFCNVTSENDPKAELARRYRELCRVHIQLATRAAESEEAYNIAMLGLNNILSEVALCFKEKSSQESSQVISPPIGIVVCDIDKRLHTNDDNTGVRGIKTRAKVLASSSRPKNALEKAIKKKRNRKKVPLRSGVDTICISGTERVQPSILQMPDSISPQIKFREPLPPLTQQMPILVPPQMQFTDPFHFSQEHHVEGNNTGINYMKSSRSMMNLLQPYPTESIYQESSISMLDLLQTQIPSVRGFDLICSQHSSLKKNPDVEAQDAPENDIEESSKANL